MATEPVPPEFPELKAANTNSTILGYFYDVNHVFFKSEGNPVLLSVYPLFALTEQPPSFPTGYCFSLL